MSKEKIKSEETGEEKISEQTTGGVKPMNDEELTGIVGGNGNGGNNDPPPPDPNDPNDPNNQNNNNQDDSASFSSPGPWDPP